MLPVARSDRFIEAYAIAVVVEPKVKAGTRSQGSRHARCINAAWWSLWAPSTVCPAPPQRWGEKLCLMCTACQLSRDSRCQFAYAESLEQGMPYKWHATNSMD